MRSTKPEFVLEFGMFSILAHIRLQIYGKVHARCRLVQRGDLMLLEKHVAGGASGRPRSCRCLTGNAALLVASRGDLGPAGAPRVVLCFDIALGSPTGLAVAACAPGARMTVNARGKLDFKNYNAGCSNYNYMIFWHTCPNSPPPPCPPSPPLPSSPPPPPAPPIQCVF